MQSEAPKRSAWQSFAPQRLRAFFERGIWSEAALASSGLRGRLLESCRAGYLAVRGFAEDRCALRSAALTYVTVLSLVPLLAFAFSVAKGFGAYDHLRHGVIERFLDDTFGAAALAPGAAELDAQYPIPMVAPAPASDAARELRTALDQVLDFVESTDVKSLGALGLAMLLWTVVRLLTNIERTLNEIYGVQRERRLVRKVADYLAIVVLAPIFLLTAFGVTALAQNNEIYAWLELHLHIGALLGLLVPLVPLLSIWAAFTFLYLCLPNTQARLVPAVIGGIAGGTGWQLAQLLHVKFQIGVAKYNALYSSFAAIPIFLVWLYVSWMMVLAGAELASALQRGTARARARLGHADTPAAREDLALRLLLELAGAFLRGEGALKLSELGLRTNGDEGRLAALLSELRRAALVAEVATGGEPAWLLARAPESIVVTDVLAALRGSASEGWRQPGTYAARAAESLDGLRRAQIDSRDNRSLRELVAERLRAQPEERAGSSELAGGALRPSV